MKLYLFTSPLANFNRSNPVLKVQAAMAAESIQGTGKE
jgi:hypothetical protein